MAQARLVGPRTRAGRKLLMSNTAVLLLLAGSKLLLHLLANGNYGYHRDEFYYIVGGQHPAWGYVDHPPVTPLLAALAHRVAGDSLLAFRLLPTLAGVGIVLFAAAMARELGGGRFAQGLAALAVVAAPMYLIAGLWFQTIPFDQLWWVVAVWLLLRLANTGDGRLWMAVGLIAGLGLLTKHTMLLFGLALVLGLVLTPERRHLRERWLWIGGAIAVLIYLPHLIWQAANGWPTLEFIRNNNAVVRAEQSRLAFVLMQGLVAGPLGLPLAAAGLHFLLRGEGRRYRLLGLVFLIVFSVLLLLDGKFYYLGPLYPMLFAAGAVAVEHWSYERRRWARPAFVGGLVLGGILLLPGVLPILPRALFLRTPFGEMNDEMYEMFGWQELVQTVAGTYNALPPEERARTAILTSSYGAAGAIDYYGGAYGLPHAISAHNSYYHWGPGDPGKTTFIVVGYREEFVRRFFRDVRGAGVIRNDANVPNEEHNRPYFLCRDPVAPLAELWPQLKHFR